MLFFYIRHGDPIYDPDSLTPLGHRQAEALAKRLAVYGLDEIYSSTSERAKLTAQPTCELLKLEPILLDWCKESHAFKQLTVTDEQGKRKWCFDHTPTRRLLLSPEVCALRDKWYDHPAFASTQFKEGIKRVDNGTDELFTSLGYEHDRERGGYIAVAPNEKRVALFAHQGFGMAFLSSLLDIPYNIFSMKYNLSHSSMTVIRFKAESDGFCVPQVLQLANDSHIYREGLPTKYNNRIQI
ncbi:MAG: histidine phosphatase family protein [Ruminococcaceae bacterium]|nr:histidine phosphatase family protein [Oscillospiraceae bacterium]